MCRIRARKKSPVCPCFGGENRSRIISGPPPRLRTRRFASAGLQAKLDRFRQLHGAEIPIWFLTPEQRVPRQVKLISWIQRSSRFQILSDSLSTKTRHFEAMKPTRRRIFYRAHSKLEAAMPQTHGKHRQQNSKFTKIHRWSRSLPPISKASSAATSNRLSCSIGGPRVPREF